MSTPVISISGIGKAYRIGLEDPRHQTFRDALVALAKSPWQRFRKLREAEPDGQDTFWALRDISFEVERGSVVGIIGRNGAGKSTLLKILSRITEPTEGEIRLRGRVASLLEVGTGFHPELSGRENIYLNGSILGMSRREIGRKFDQIVDFSGVEQFLDTPVKRYSSGMYVRLAFAVAAHLEPEILIVDEVLAVGDTEFQKKCLGKMRQVAQGDGRTVLFVSHNMDAVLRLCQKAVVMRSGRSSALMPVTSAVQSYLGDIDEKLARLPLRDYPREISNVDRPIFTDLRITSRSGEGARIPCGGEVTIEVEMEGVEHVEELDCSIVLTNEKEQRVTLFNSAYHSGLKIIGAERTVLRCTVPSLPLTPGDYFIELNTAVAHREILERVAHAGRITVFFADILGTGRLPAYHQGHVVLPARWEQVS